MCEVRSEVRVVSTLLKLSHFCTGEYWICLTVILLEILCEMSLGNSVREYILNVAHSDVLIHIYNYIVN